MPIKRQVCQRICLNCWQLDLSLKFLLSALNKLEHLERLNVPTTLLASLNLIFHFMSATAKQGESLQTCLQICSVFVLGLFEVCFGFARAGGDQTVGCVLAWEGYRHLHGGFCGFSDGQTFVLVRTGRAAFSSQSFPPEQDRTSQSYGRGGLVTSTQLL